MKTSVFLQTITHAITWKHFWRYRSKLATSLPSSFHLKLSHNSSALHLWANLPINPRKSINAIYKLCWLSEIQGEFISFFFLFILFYHHTGNDEIAAKTPVLALHLCELTLFQTQGNRQNRDINFQVWALGRLLGRQIHPQSKNMHIALMGVWESVLVVSELAQI